MSVRGYLLRARDGAIKFSLRESSELGKSALEASMVDNIVKQRLFKRKSSPILDFVETYDKDVHVD